MFVPLLNLRLRILDSCNELSDEEQEPTARAWIDILNLEAASLVAGVDEWYSCTVDRNAGSPSADAQRARTLGLADGRLSLIVADQFVAALIRGHLTGVES